MSRGHGRWALAYAERLGWPVFPTAWPTSLGVCSCPAGAGCPRPAKHPRVRGGLTAATTERGQIIEWWSRWPGAGVAVATGPEAGLAVLDLDTGDALAALVVEHGQLPETTMRARTGRGGWHYFFAWPERGTVPTRAGWPVEGADVRGAGGYVLLPPSGHASGRRYVWEAGPAEAPLAPCPPWLVEPERELAPPAPARAWSGYGDGTRYGLAALVRACDRIRSAGPSGSLNHALNREAFGIGQLVGGGQLAEGTAREALRAAALAAGHGLRDDRPCPAAEATMDRTIRSGFEDGLRSPRVPEGVAA